MEVEESEHFATKNIPSFSGTFSALPAHTTGADDASHISDSERFPVAERSGIMTHMKEMKTQHASDRMRVSGGAVDAEFRMGRRGCHARIEASAWARRSREGDLLGLPCDTWIGPLRPGDFARGTDNEGGTAVRPWARGGESRGAARSPGDVGRGLRGGGGAPGRARLRRTRDFNPAARRPLRSGPRNQRTRHRERDGKAAYPPGMGAARMEGAARPCIPAHAGRGASGPVSERSRGRKTA